MTIQKKGEKKYKSECCKAEVRGVMEYAREEPWGAVGEHYECSDCGKEVDFCGRDIEKLYN
jgi:hypothetical protein